MNKTPINPDFLPTPEAKFNRATELDLGSIRMLIISGTASVGDQCQTMYPDDFEKQVRHTYSNISRILAERRFCLTDVAQWRIYLKDIAKTYDLFNQCRDRFFEENGIARLDYGSSTCVEARLCREDLLVEIEAVAVKCAS